MQLKTQIIAFIFIFTVIGIKASAKEPIKFGKIEIEEFNVKVYAPDTSASAVILCQYGYFDATRFEFIFLRRVKILKKGGVQYADYNLRGGDDVNVRGKTYNLENGVIVEDKLKNESVFRERIIEKYYRIRIAMPNVKVGSIVDIEITQSGLPSVFRFQERIPVKLAQLDLENNPKVEFRKRMLGYINVAKIGFDNYKAENVPAFKTEPYMSSEENYISKFEFDLLRISLPNYYKTFTSSWQDVDKYFCHNPNFGEVIFSSGGYLSDLSNDLEKKYSDPLERTKAACEAIKSVNWNKSEWLYPSNNLLSSAYKKKDANSAELNMMLCQLLNRMDITATPVIMSTRENGILNEFFPSLEKINYVIVCATIDGKDYLMDPTEKYLPFGMLPERCLNNSGRTFNKAGEGRWVSLNSEKKDATLTVYDLSLADGLVLTGKMQKSRNGYSAFDFRKEFKEFASDENFINDMESNNSGLIIKDYKISNIDSLDQATLEDYDTEIKNRVENVNGLISINPYFYDQSTENPFKLENREYPVEFPYKINESIITKILVPENYVPEQIPKPVSIKLPDNDASATVSYSFSGNTLLVRYVMQINKLLFLPNEYELLREFYNQIIKTQAKPIILKQVTNAAKL
jgi:hypothetical protein